MTSPNHSEGLPISALDLAAAYARNEHSAAASYKGKVLEIIGIMNTAGRNSRGNLFATLEAGVQGSITCYFLESESAKVSSLVHGQSVTARGRDDTSVSFLVTLRDCIVVENEESPGQGNVREAGSVFVATAVESPGHGDLVQAQLQSVTAEMSASNGEATADLDQAILSALTRP